MANVECKIHFYRADAGRSPAGVPLPFHPAPLLEHVDGLSWEEGSSGRLWPSNDGRLMSCSVDAVGDRCRARLLNVRRTALPEVIARGGDITPLGIPSDSGLCERTHVVFFDGNILAADFNFYGPRVTRFADYLFAKCRGRCPNHLRFNMLLRLDALEELRRLRHIRVMRIGVRPANIQAIAERDSDLGAAFRSSRQLGDPEQIELMLKTTGRGAWLHEDVIPRIQRLLSHDDVRPGLTTLSVRGVDAESGKMENLNLLSDKLVAVRSIVLQDERSRALDHESAYGAIEAAYEEIAEDVRRAAEVSIGET